jgi:hypothetical protein
VTSIVRDLLPPYYEPWTEYATCRSIGPTMFYPEEGDKWTDAINVCKTACSVRLQCLDYAMRSELGRPINHRHGVWAGLKPHQRRKLEPEWLAGQESAA